MSEKRIGRYVAERVLGAGAFATVWLALDDILETRVAIKVLADNWARNPGIRQRFVEEARILRRIDHDRIIRVHEINELDDGRPYFVMALADRGTLETRQEEYRSRGMPFPLDEALRLTIELCEALAVVHDFGVVHRDIKPSNMLFREVRPHERAAAKRLGIDLGDEVVVLGDFGLAKDLAAGDGFTVAAGTPAYMAPEQAQASADIDHRVDVFAATAVLYELVAGSTAFAAGSLSEVRSSRASLSFTRLGELRSDVPAELDRIIERGLAANRDDRFPTVTDLADALVRVRAEIGPDEAHAGIHGVGKIQGPTRRILDLVPLIRPRMDASELSRLAAAEDRLGRPLAVAFVGDAPDERLVRAAEEAGATVTTAAPTGPEIDDADAVIVVIGSADSDPIAAIDAVIQRAAAASAGPVCIEAVVVADDSARPADEIVTLLRSAPRIGALCRSAAVLNDASILRLATLLRELAEHQAPLIRAASGLRLLTDAAEGAASPAQRSQILQAIDLVSVELPELEAIDTLRKLAVGSLALAGPLRDAVTPLLMLHSPALRLGLSDTATQQECAARAAELSTNWRVLENTGRIPYSSRQTMLVAQRALDELQLDLAGEA